MKHSLQISLGRPELADSIVKCRKVKTREKIMNLLFGKPQTLTVIIPGSSVECISIREIPKGESDE